MIQSNNPILQLEYSNMYGGYQISIIKKAYEEKLDYKKLLNPIYDLAQMNEIYLGLKRKLKVSLYSDVNLNFKQMEQIRKGLLKNNNILRYISKDQDAREMQQLRIAMEKGLDSKYLRIIAKPEYNFKQMQEIRLAIEEGKDYNQLLNPKLTYLDMYNIRVNL